MKKITLLGLLLTLVFTFSFLSCNQDDDDPFEGRPKMTANVNGTTWEAGVCKSVVTLTSTSISGLCSIDPDIYLYLQHFAKGSYDLSWNTGDYALIVDDGKTYITNLDSTTSGNITISSINLSDSTISGTFEFVASGGADRSYRIVKEGSFSDVIFTSTFPIPQNQYFQVDIDGVTFKPSLIGGGIMLDNILVTASDNPMTKMINLEFPQNISPGTYSIGTSIIASYGVSPNIYYYGVSGSVTISEHNKSSKYIKGTFEFTAKNTDNDEVQLTNGSFAINYISN